MDGYNTDRVEINRGANALLFGVGSPAGIINTSSVAAELQRSRGEVEASVGSYASYRLSFDYNVVPWRGDFAVRVAAVKDDEKYQQEFAFTDSERKYAAATWDVAPLRNRGILDSTVIRASYERGRIVSNNPRVLPPADRLSSWFDATLPDNLKALAALVEMMDSVPVLDGVKVRFVPLEHADANVVAQKMDVTPTAGGFTITMPSVKQVSVGQDAYFSNVGAYSFTLLDNAGGVIGTVAAAKRLVL
jgi:hypothetical protein